MRQPAKAMLLALCALRAAAAQPTATVVDHGLRAAAYPRYLGRGPGLGWQDLYNQDDRGRYWLLREIEFRGTRIPWRIGQTYAGDTTHPVGRVGLRFAQSGHRVTRTQPRWLATWGRHDEKFPGLLDVRIDGTSLVGAPVEIAPGHTGSAAHVALRWAHAKGAVRTLLVMRPDDDRLFAEVAVRPREQADRVTVSLCCWPLGRQPSVRTASAEPLALPYGKQVDLPPGDATVLFADPAFDPVGKGQDATCGLTYVPEECLSASATRRFPLFVEFELAAPQAGEAVHAHLALWELLHRRGDAAWAYLAAREANTLAQFESLPGMQAPRLAERRRAELAEARRELRQVNQALNAAGLVRERPALREGYWALSRQAIHALWAAFYRDEAAYCLDAEDWRAGRDAVQRAAYHAAAAGQ